MITEDAEGKEDAEGETATGHFTRPRSVTPGSVVMLLRALQVSPCPRSLRPNLWAEARVPIFPAITPAAALHLSPA
jgi:hypothetical protein